MNGTYHMQMRQLSIVPENRTVETVKVVLVEDQVPEIWQLGKILRMKMLESVYGQIEFLKTWKISETVIFQRNQVVISQRNTKMAKNITKEA